MAIEHSAIQDSDLHEMKGAASAVSGQVPVATGSGSTNFRLLLPSDINGLATVGSSNDYNDLNNLPTSVGYTSIVSGRQYSNQIPVGLDTPLQVLYGPGEVTTDVTIAASGAITFNTAGQYLLLLVHRVGRTAATGTANFYMRFLIDGSTIGAPLVWSMDNATITQSASLMIPLNVTAGQVFTTEILRDSSGTNYGSLFTTTPNAAGWDAAPSSTAVAYKLGGLQ